MPTYGLPLVKDIFDEEAAWKYVLTLAADRNRYPELPMFLAQKDIVAPVPETITGIETQSSTPLHCIAFPSFPPTPDLLVAI
jgi:hypothetical protein